MSPDRACAGWTCGASRGPRRTPSSFSTWSCERVVAALLWTTIRSATGIAPSSEVAFAELKNFGHEGSSSRLSGEQESALSDWVETHCPRSIREIAAFLKRTFGQSYSRSGLIALLHRLGFDYRKPEAMPRGLDDARQQAFIDQYEPRSFALRQARETCVPDSPQVLCPQLALVRNQPLDLSGWCGLVGRIGDKASNRSRIRATSSTPIGYDPKLGNPTSHPIQLFPRCLVPAFGGAG